MQAHYCPLCAHQSYDHEILGTYLGFVGGVGQILRCCSCAHQWYQEVEPEHKTPKKRNPDSSRKEEAVGKK